MRFTPQIPNGLHGIEAERVIHRRSAADAFAATDGDGTVNGCAAPLFRVQHAHVPLALIEEIGAEPAALLYDDDFFAGELAQSAGEHAAGGAGADDENVALERVHHMVRFALSRGPA